MSAIGVSAPPIPLPRVNSNQNVLPLPGALFQADLPPHQVDEVPTDGQPEAGAAVPAAAPP